MYGYLPYLQLNSYTLMVELSVGKKWLLRCEIGFGPRHNCRAIFVVVIWFGTPPGLGDFIRDEEKKFLLTNPFFSYEGTMTSTSIAGLSLDDNEAIHRRHPLLSVLEDDAYVDSIRQMRDRVDGTARPERTALRRPHRPCPRQHSRLRLFGVFVDSGAPYSLPSCCAGDSTK